MALPASDSARPSDDPANPLDAAWADRDELVLYARRLLGTRGDLAEDCVQEAFLRLHERVASGSAVLEARPWLFRVTRNLALDERRRGRRGDDARISLGVVATQPKGPLELLQGKEEARQVLEGLGALPPRERRTVILDQAGLEPSAIARRMKTTPNAVHQSLFRARRRMRDTRAAAWGLLPLPLIRLFLRTASSPAVERLPTLAPGSGGRFAGGASLAGLVAAAVIGGGVVVDQAVLPHPAHVRVSTPDLAQAPRSAASVPAPPALRHVSVGGSSAVRGAVDVAIAPEGARALRVKRTAPPDSGETPDRSARAGRPDRAAVTPVGDEDTRPGDGEADGSPAWASGEDDEDRPRRARVERHHRDREDGGSGRIPVEADHSNESSDSSAGPDDPDREDSSGSSDGAFVDDAPQAAPPPRISPEPETPPAPEPPPATEPTTTAPPSAASEGG